MPRVMSCLHVVCEGCLETLLLDETGETNNCSIACPVCKQMTTVSVQQLQQGNFCDSEIFFLWNCVDVFLLL